MKVIRAVPLVGAVLVLLAGALLAPAVSAHTDIASVRWDNPASPTRLIAATAGDPINSAAGTYSLKVFNASGIQVDNGDARVLAPFTEVSVGIPGSLPSGTYTVEWTVAGEDGHGVSGSHTIALSRGSTAAPVSTPSSGGHSHAGATESHGATDHSDADEAHDHDDSSKLEKATLDLNLTGAQEVPAVSSAASAFARITIDPETNEFTWAITVSGVAPQAVTGLHLHRGGAGQNGPHMYDIINEGFTTTSGSTTLSDADIADIYAGNSYLRLHTVDYPSGAARAQLAVPAAEHDHPDHDHGSSVTPPSTGEAGLAAPGTTGSAASLLVAIVAVLSFSTAGVFVVARR